MQRRIIWQYWEIKGFKPKFIDGLYNLACKNSGVEVIQVTPDTLFEYLPELPPRILEVKELAHKADLIRSRLLKAHGGVWLDSDAIVLKDLNWMFDALETHDFIAFNDEGAISDANPNLRINCLGSVPNGRIISAWVENQEARLNQKTVFKWSEIGAELLNPACVEHRENVAMFPYSRICPVPWKKVSKFGSSWSSPLDIIDATDVVMLSNNTLKKRLPNLLNMTAAEIASRNIYLAHFLRRAEDESYIPDSTKSIVLKKLGLGFLAR